MSRVRCVTNSVTHRTTDRFATSYAPSMPRAARPSSANRGLRERALPYILGAMSSPRLSIRVDVDVEHARLALDTQLARDVTGGTAPPDRGALADTVRSLRERLHGDVSAAYPGARVVVTMWRKEPKARATKVRVGHRMVDGHTERRCALICEHVDALRTAAIEAMRRGVTADAAQWDGGSGSVARLADAPPTFVATSDGERSAGAPPV